MAVLSLFGLAGVGLRCLMRILSTTSRVIAMCAATPEDIATSQYGTMMGLYRAAPTAAPWRAFAIG